MKRFARHLAMLLFASASTAIAFADKASPAELKVPRRPPWASSRIKGSPEPPRPYATERIFPNLEFENPVELVPAPGSDRLFLAELGGRFYSFPLHESVSTPDILFDLRSHVPESGNVYGLVFHPRFEENGFCYICYVTKDGDPQGTRVSRFKLTQTDPPRIDAKSEKVIITWYCGGHNGGCLQFGPDGYLYISTGDGVGPFPPDTFDTGQDLSDLLSSILRIDVNRTDGDIPYRVPSDNPFIELANARPEIWAYGFRNPWKMSFDPRNGNLWAGDVGWELWELVFRVERGGNYGWSVMEGRQTVRPGAKRGPTPILPPTVDHPHTEACSITGGYVYYGDRLPELRGAYIYGDYVTGKIWGLRYENGAVTWHEELAESSLAIICFGVDPNGELLIVDYAGTIHRLIPNRHTDDDASFPTRLTETGLFSSVVGEIPAPGVIPYEIRLEPWMDGATAQRYAAIPGTDVIRPGNDALSFPQDSVLAKTISLPVVDSDSPAEMRRLETQVFHYDGRRWNGYTYIWNDEQTDAVLADAAGLERTFFVRDSDSTSEPRQQTWHFAGRTECLVCHNPRAGNVLGFDQRQLTKNVDHQGNSVNQLELLRQVGVLAEFSGKQPSSLCIDGDATATLYDRARSYLHVNCAHCHRNGGGGTATLEIQLERPLERTGTLDEHPTQGTFGIYDSRIIAPGDPYRSVLYYRMLKLEKGRMPHLGSSVVDSQGTRLIHNWIKQLPRDSQAEKPLATDEMRRTQREKLAGLSNSSGPENRTDVEECIAQLLSTPSGALLLLTAMQDKRLADAYKEIAISAATSHPNSAVSGLFETFVPENQRTQRLGTAVNPESILAAAGNADRGRALFFQADGMQCKTCHRVGEIGGEIGPSLDKISSKYDRYKMLESILDPSKFMEPSYVPYLAETTEGQVHTGLLIKRDDREVILRLADGKDVHLRPGDIGRLTPQQISLMPELLLRDLTIQDAADLLAYLSSLR